MSPQFFIQKTKIYFLLGAITLWFWGSALSFFPVPWPDDSAFYLTGLQWLGPPYQYRMHAQAAFVPSYDIANFNTMPFLPLLMGVSRWIGIDTLHEIRIFGMICFFLWASLLVFWMRHRGFHPLWAGLIGLGALFSPPIRWGAMVVRPEIWQGLIWLLLLMEMDGVWKKRNLWRLPLLLALAAYIHFQAYLWILPVGLFLIFKNKEPHNLRLVLYEIWKVFWRTLVLLLPWVAYAIWHWDLFLPQMQIQFERLAIPNDFVRDAYGFFHNIFIGLGFPVSYPKFFNLGKIITWIALVVSFGVCVYRVVFLPSRERAVYLAAATALLMAFHLWISKPETWFTVLIHLCFWPVLVLSIPTALHKKISHGVLMTGMGLLLMIEIGVAAYHYQNTKNIYTWDQYNKWVSCIDQAIGLRKEIWQPHWPDVLVELSNRHPEKSYTRAVDFSGVHKKINALVGRADVIIHSSILDFKKQESKKSYEGPPRKEDLFFVTDYPWMPFKEFNASRLGKDWHFYTCHAGPFVALLSLRDI